ncbi:MAG TPA: hypothetical protein VII49_08130 [Rhizomicrobium sp.]
MSRLGDGSPLLDLPALRRAVLVGTPIQALTALVSHFGSLLASHAIGFLFAGMMISATMGYLYALDVAKGYGPGARGGAVAGGVCAVGIAISVLLGDMALSVWVLHGLISVLTGAVGGVYGQLAADWN